ncbi:MAG: hypothetical protein J7621_25120, partial [Niastella sp.]|nr:hypothetical protein [Niastella sp.]
MLQETIELAYRIFRHYPAMRPLDVCTEGCCMEPAGEERLAIMPVQEIPLSLLMEYNDGAKSSKTPTGEVKHFLPRYFELVSNFQFPSHSTELSFCRLAPFDQQEWTADELEVLNSFAIEFFRKCLHAYPID